MSRSLPTRMFIAVAFLLGSINVLYNVVFYIFLILAFLVNVKMDFRGFLHNLCKEWKYILLPLVGCVYLTIHYLCTLDCSLYAAYRPSWSSVELLLLYFFMIPLYVLSVRNFVTPLLLKKALSALCWGILLLNFVKLFYVAGLTLFTHPLMALNTLYTGRFGEDMAFLGGFVYLEPQAIYLVISALISYFFILKQIRVKDSKRFVAGCVFVFVFSLLFLSFTVTKGAILSFIGGVVVLSIAYLRRISPWVPWAFLIVFLLLLFGTWFFLPHAYVNRIEEMEREIESVQRGEFAGATISSRAGIIKENMQHFHQFAWFGLGVYKKAMTNEWYKNSPYIDVVVTNAHNSFLEFWLRWGIGGVLYLFYFFFAPVIRMLRQKKGVYLTLACIIALCIGNSTSILIILVDSSPFVILFLAMGYFYNDIFYQLQETEITSA